MSLRVSEIAKEAFLKELQETGTYLNLIYKRLSPEAKEDIERVFILAYLKGATYEAKVFIERMK